MPEPGAPLELWLQRVLADNQDRLTAHLVRRSLGNEAEHAFRFDGVELLSDFLERWSSRSRLTHKFVVDGVVELTANLDPLAGSPEYGGARRLERLQRFAEEESTTTPVSMDVALGAAKHFYLLARASFERARFDKTERAADIAVFETFRIASIAADTDGELGASELELLSRIASWHHAAAKTSHDELTGRLSAGVELVASSVISSARHSLVLHVTAANATVKERLRACALELMDTTLRLDGLTALEGLALETTPDDAPMDRYLADDLALVAKSVFIIPNRRAGQLKADPEFERLWKVYRSAVPWTTTDGPPTP